MAKRPVVPESELGKRILQAREELGITQNELARRVGIGGGALAKWNTGARGQRADVVTVFALAQALGVRAEWLWLGRGPKKDTSMSTRDRAATSALQRGATATAVAIVDAREGERHHPFDWWVQEYLSATIAERPRQSSMIPGSGMRKKSS